MNNEELVRPVMKGGIMRDEMGNPPGTIYFLENTIERFKNKFFGKKPEIIPEPIPEVVKEKTFEELIAEKLDLIFNCNHLCCFRPLRDYERGSGENLRERFVHKNFRFSLFREEYLVEIYDATEPELVERVYTCELQGTLTYSRFNNNTHSSRLYKLYYRYIPGIWDEQFLETLDELVLIKNNLRIAAAEKKQKEIEQEELNRKLAEEVKQDRIRKMFEKNP